MSARQQRSSVTAGLLWSIALACLASACGSSSISVTSPSGEKCSVSVTNSISSVPAAGASGTLTIATNRDCTWSASTPTPWISIASSTNGQGEATLTYRVAANIDPSPRHGVVTVNDTTVEVTQEPAPCRYTVTPPEASSPASGGSISVAVGASSPACGWTATPTASWITIASGSSGSGNGTVVLTVLPNGGEAREATVVIADLPVTVSQPALAELPTPTPLPPPNPAPPIPAPPAPAPTPTPCTYTLEPITQAIAASGGSGAIAVSSGSSCAWTATTAASWITITGGTSGQGTGTVSFSAAPNGGAARSATIQIGTSTATITQASAGCIYAISPPNQAVGAGGGTGSVSVTAGAGCSWTATEEVSWISITSGATGSGNGTVNFSVSANTGAARTAMLTIAGRPFTVTQAAAACSYSIAPASQSIIASGGTGTIAVTSANGCTWNATANANWLTITSAASGSGNGSVTFSAAANTGAARTGTLTIAGQTFTVEQEGAACTFSLSATSQNAVAAGGPGSVIVTAASTCAWTAVSNVAWVAVTSGASGTGTGSVSFTIAANTGAARSGTLTIAGHTYTVVQDGASCNFAAAPPTQNAGAGGGTASVSVTTASSCTWTAVSNAAWIVVTSGASGTGNGTVVLTVAANTGAARSGTVTVAGQTVTVTQDALPCTFTIAPPAQNLPAAGGGGTVAVTAGAGCSWSATSNADWLSITAGSSGSGNGAVTYNAAANAISAARTGTLTIAGQTFTVTQSGQ
jgi:hypothetical protein